MVNLAWSKYSFKNKTTTVAVVLFLDIFLTWQITSLIRTSPESFNGSLLMMYF